ncbi:MAG: response regulator [Anaerolineae bacterium]|nr:response regulator [Anaerolineae bacterium]
MSEVTSRSALIVDDNFYNRDLSAIALRHSGYTVNEAKNGAEALLMLQRQHFDLLVLDLAMPEMNGTELLRQLNARNLKHDMCVIVMTANPHMALGDVVDEHADYVLFKPIDIMEFTRFTKRLSETSRPAMLSS